VIHTERLSVPGGWMVVRHESLQALARPTRAHNLTLHFERERGERRRMSVVK
jgi:hypothetical protein